MLLDLISEAITNVSKNVKDVTPLMVTSPMPLVGIEWDAEEGKIKIRETKKSFFDPRQY